MEARTSTLAGRHAAEKAVGMAMPLIEEAMKHKEVGESGFLYIVVMDPLRKPGTCSFEEAILYEHAVGDRSKWDADYAGFARAKARVAWRTGLDSHVVQELYPHLLAPGDTVLWGTAIVDGIVVGVSGANAWYDEAFAGTVAMCMRAIARAGVVAARKEGLFLPKE
ncbi:hypothetical protein [Noviherbaspirillum galbum]|uniref:Uncharacterized protein n=1 Tax=Noviherbaspirillum galbum TaxID=2709383 RepID=A0A6B3SM31_9BURK|nr:hypothetical protein [Noviherbaspirillum galbum]NEX60365.1 hypothetical protein [Noviherbaspirillum galbum]